MRPTASKASLLIQCAYPFDNPAVALDHGEPSEAAEYGTLFHLWMAKSIAAGELQVSGDAKLDAHVAASWRKLQAWLKANNWSGSWTLVEHPMAYCPKTETARVCKPVDAEEHVYPDQRPDEIAGTADMLVIPSDKSRAILILDHKTGLYGDFSRPERLEQLLALALAACALFERTHFVAAVLHTPKDGIPIVYSSDEMDLSDVTVRVFAKVLRKQLERVGDGSMRPGANCKYCPARFDCPTQTADLLKRCSELVEKANLIGSEIVLASDAGKGSKEERLGRLHLLLARFRELDKKASAELKRELQADEELEPIRPDGKKLVIRHKSQIESLSKSTITRALGKAKGEELIQKLRDMGCTEYRDQDELRAE